MMGLYNRLVTLKQTGMGTIRLDHLVLKSGFKYRHCVVSEFDQDCIFFGRVHREAKADLLEKIRQAQER